MTVFTMIRKGMRRYEIDAFGLLGSHSDTLAIVPFIMGLLTWRLHFSRSHNTIIPVNRPVL